LACAVYSGFTKIVPLFKSVRRKFREVLDCRGPGLLVRGGTFRTLDLGLWTPLSAFDVYVHNFSGRIQSDFCFKFLLRILRGHGAKKMASGCSPQSQIGNRKS
jgi:hypothetical protein